MTAVICYSRCWSCQFGHHEGGPHTWMDEEDVKFSSTVAWPDNPHAWRALAETHPCNCWCLTTPPCRVCHGSGEHPDDDERPCYLCAGHGHDPDRPAPMRAPAVVRVPHGPAAVRRDLTGHCRPSAGRIRRVMDGCRACRAWAARRNRISALHRAYRQRKAHR